MDKLYQTTPSSQPNPSKQTTDKEILDQMVQKTQTSDPNKKYSYTEYKKIYLKLRTQLRKEQKDFSKGNFKGKSQEMQRSCQEGISWGLVDDDEVYQMAQEDEDNKLIVLDYHALRLLPNLTDKQLLKIDQAEIKKNKVEGIENELQSLQEIEARSFGLEEGKKRRKEAMENKLNECLLDFEMAEENLKFLIFGERTMKSLLSILLSIKKEKIGKIQDEDTYGDDEFFDRTHKQVHKSDSEILQRILKQQAKTTAPLINNTNPLNYEFANVENFESLQKKLKFFIEERNKLNLEFLEIQENEANEERKTIDDDDELGAFLKQNEKKLIGEKKLHHLERIKYLQTQIEKTKALMELSNPGAKIQEPVPDTPKKKDPQAPKAKLPKPQTKQQQSNISKTLQQLKQKAQAFHNATRIEDPNSDDLQQYIPALKQLENEEARMEMHHRDRMLLDQRMRNEEQQQKEEEERLKQYGVKKKPKERNLTEAQVGEKADVGWRPPENQTGDGRTSLNEKLGY